jgi:WhiB family redox-sensing transcriptional regulator
VGVTELLTREVCSWMMSESSIDQSLPDLLNRPGWMKRGACRGVDRSEFFPSLGGTTTKARAICAVCPVRQECLEYALADTELAGVWGGTSERERKTMRRSVA